MGTSNGAYGCVPHFVQGGGSGVNAIVAALASPDADVIEVTHAEITTHITNSTLVPGLIYKITDFQTIHAVRNLVNIANTGAIEEIMVMAATINTLVDHGWSATFPEDDIWYDVTITEVVTGTFNKGVIYRRRDNTRNIDFIPRDGVKDKSNDFRTVKSPFWFMDKADLNGTGTGYFSPYPSTISRTYDASSFVLGPAVWTPVVQTITIVDTNDYILRNIFELITPGNVYNVTSYGSLEEKSVLFGLGCIDSSIPYNTTELYVNQFFLTNNIDPRSRVNGMYDFFQSSRFSGESQVDLWTMQQNIGGIFSATGNNCNVSDSFIRQISGVNFGSSRVTNCNVLGQLEHSSFSNGGSLSGVQCLGSIQRLNLDGTGISNFDFQSSMVAWTFTGTPSNTIAKGIIVGNTNNVKINMSSPGLLMNLNVDGDLRSTIIGPNATISVLNITGSCTGVQLDGSFSNTTFNNLTNTRFHDGASGTVLGDIIDTTFHQRATGLAIAVTKKIDKCTFSQVVATFSITEDFTNNAVLGKVTSVALTSAHDSKTVLTDTGGALIEQSITAGSATYTTLT